MSKPDLVTIDLGTLTTVTGGKHHGGGDPLLNDLKYLASSIKDITKQTSGLSSSTMMLLCVLALQRNNSGMNNTNVVYVSRGRRW